MVGAGAREGLEVALRLDDHQMDVERLGGRLANRRDDQGAEADVGDEAAVHDVDVDPVGAGRVDGTHLFGEATDVGGEDRGCDDDRLHPAL